MTEGGGGGGVDTAPGWKSAAAIRQAVNAENETSETKAGCFERSFKYRWLRALAFAGILPKFRFKRATERGSGKSWRLHAT